MAIELVVPKVGESITEVQIVEWLKKEGDRVERDGNLAVIETDKATVELPAPVAGVLTKILKGKGSVAKVGEVIGYIEEGAAHPAHRPRPHRRPPRRNPMPANPAPASASVPRPARSPPSRRTMRSRTPSRPGGRHGDAGRRARPRRKRTAGLGRPGHGTRQPPAQGRRSEGRGRQGQRAGRPARGATFPGQPVPAPPLPAGSRSEEAVPMSMLRRKVAERLVQAQQTAALLTTFNEIDMTEMMELRKRHQDAFVKKYGIKLGFMSFFVKAAVEALKLIPQINAEIRGNDIIYKHYYDIGVAVGGGKGLVVPVLRNAESPGLRPDRAGHRRLRPSAPRPTPSSWRSCRAAPSPSATAASTAPCCPRPSSIRRKAASWACTPSRIAPWPATARWSSGP